MTVLFSRNGDDLLFDYVRDGRIYGHVSTANGVSYPTQLVDSIVARGYWEVVTPMSAVLPTEILKYDPDQPRDELGRFGSGSGGSDTPQPINPSDSEKIISTLNYQREEGFIAENNSPVWDMTVTSYTDGTGQYNNINGYLREGEFYAEAAGLSPSEVTKTEGDIANLTAIIDAAPPLTEDLVTFRGMTGEDVVYQFSNLEVGDQYTEAGFISTSVDKEVAERFTGGSNVNEDRMMLQIISPAGTQGLMPESYQREVTNAQTGEKEWLIQRGTTFDVLAVSDNLITVQVNNEVPRVF
jgi:hypothetical protein